MKTDMIRLYRDADPQTNGAPPAEGEPPVTPPQVPPPAEPPVTPPAEPPATPPAPPEEQLNEEEQFWQSIVAEHGVEPEELEEILGSVEDPLSPQAVVAYGNSLVARTQEAMMEQFRQEDPRAYAYRLHRKNGGSDEDFLDPAARTLPERSTLEADISLQKAYYRQALVRGGLEPEQADILIEDAARKGVLKDRTFRALDTDEERERQILAQIEARDKEANETLTRHYQSINNSLRTVVEKSDGLRINIPAASRQVFTEFLNSKMVHDGRNFMFALPINPNSDDFRDIIQGMYLMFNKSDVSQMMVKRDPAVTGPRARLASKIVPPATTPETHPVEEAEFTISSMLKGARGVK